MGISSAAAAYSEESTAAVAAAKKNTKKNAVYVRIYFIFCIYMQSHSMQNLCMQGCHSLVGNAIELDAVGSQLEPDLTTVCVCTAAPLWCGLGCQSLNSSGLIKLQLSLPLTCTGNSALVFANDVKKCHQGMNHIQQRFKFKLFQQQLVRLRPASANTLHDWLVLSVPVGQGATATSRRPSAGELLLLLILM